MSLHIDVVGILGAAGSQQPLDGPRTRIFQGTLHLGSLPLKMPAFQIQSPQVDREHAVIYVHPDDGSWHIRDLGSERGTWLFPGPVRIEDVPLSGTRTLALGDTVIRVSVLPDG